MARRPFAWQAVVSNRVLRPRPSTHNALSFRTARQPNSQISNALPRGIASRDLSCTSPPHAHQEESSGPPLWRRSRSMACQITRGRHISARPEYDIRPCAWTGAFSMERWRGVAFGHSLLHVTCQKKASHLRKRLGERLRTTRGEYWSNVPESRHWEFPGLSCNSLYTGQMQYTGPS